ncbi:hypothetical protein EG830_15400 [bacterium]|nr:hypothetical protein [bacterium]
MENEENLMTGEESLRVITDMINKTRVSIAQVSFHLLLWGWLIFACSLSEYLLWKYAGWTNSWYVWFTVIAGVLISFSYGFAKGKRERIFTYGTRIYVWTWIAFFWASVVFFIVFPVSTGSVGKYMLLMAAVPLLISGVIINFRPMMWGAVAFWILALAAHFGGETVSGLAVPAAMVTGYLVPGYLLRIRGNHDTVQGA